MDYEIDDQNLQFEVDLVSEMDEKQLDKYLEIVTILLQENP